MYFNQILNVLLLATAIAANRFWTKKEDEDLGKPQQAYLQLADCPFQIEPIGCFKDKATERALPDHILNGRDLSLEKDKIIMPQIQWTNYNHWLANFICYGAKKLFEAKPDAKSDYIGVQHYGEIWANTGSKATEYNKHGKTLTCLDGDYKGVTSEEPTQCSLFAGQDLTNYVYKVTQYKSVENRTKGCPYFQSKGCWADKEPWHKDIKKRPMEKYALNERDPYASNWNGKLIDWVRWGKGYLAELLCKCADQAKKEGMKFFSIQFYGECWISNEEPRFKEDGSSTKCVDGEWGVCDMNNGMGKKCRTHYCAGQAQANKVYEIMQGPDKCSASPCKNDGKCLTIGKHNYVCECNKGFKGKDCEEANPVPVVDDQVLS